MKLRIQGNSVRIRVTKSETAQLTAGVAVEQCTQFGPSSCLRSSVTPSPTIQKTCVQFSNDKLAVFVPADEARRWGMSDSIAIERSEDIGSGTVLRILLEKDFQCLHSSAEEQGD